MLNCLPHTGTGILTPRLYSLGYRLDLDFNFDVDKVTWP